MIYTKQQIVGSTQVGADANLSPLGLFGMVESAITECMGRQKIDGLSLRRLYNAFWVFTKNKVQILGCAHWGEVLTVESFISSISAAKLIVDTAVKSGEGNLIAYSRCEMCALDVSNGRIRRTSTVGVDASFVETQFDMDVKFDKIDDCNGEAVGSVTVKSTNIDSSQHTNNVEYLRFLLNTYSVAELLSHPISQIQIDYISQSYEEDTLSIYKTSTGNTDVFSVTKDEETVIKCAVAH